MTGHEVAVALWIGSVIVGLVWMGSKIVEERRAYWRTLQLEAARRNQPPPAPITPMVYGACVMPDCPNPSWWRWHSAQLNIEYEVCAFHRHVLTATVGGFSELVVR